MSSTTATRTAAGRPQRSAPATDDRSGAPSRFVGQSGSGVIGRADRPVLRIVADGECAPVTTRVGPVLPGQSPGQSPVASPGQSPVASPVGSPNGSPVGPIPLRRVALDEFFAVDGESQQLRMAARGTVRLTRRGRSLILGVALTATLGLGVTWASGSAATDHPERTRVVVVAPGDTLWDIASQTAQGGDVRAAMSHLEQLNHLDTSVVRAGQRLRVPIG